MGATSIEWTDFSINPIRARDRVTGKVGHYCEKTGAGCQNCYSSRLQPRFGTPTFGAGQHLDRVEVFLDDGKLKEVIGRKKPTKFFWCDMTDLFGAWVSDEMIDHCLAAMALSPQHTHQLLTKRPERMAEYMSRLARSITPLETAARSLGWTLQFRHPDSGKLLGLVPWPIPSVWCGTSVENQTAADERIPHLLRTPAAVRFLSCEPLLGAVDLNKDETVQYCCACGQTTAIDLNINGGDCANCGDPRTRERGYLDSCLIQWVIVGGESGPGARPMHPDWARNLRDQCVAAGVPYFFKQWGRWAPWANEDHYTHCGEERHAHTWIDSRTGDHGLCWIVDDDGDWSNWTGSPDMNEHGRIAEHVAVMGDFSKKAAGRLLDGREWNEFPEAAPCPR